VSQWLKSAKTSKVADGLEWGLSILLHNLYPLSAAIEEITKWLSENGVENIAVNAAAAVETLDAYVKATLTRLYDFGRSDSSPLTP
jgi:hypothetical protein